MISHEIVSSLRDEFVQEADSAPKLFKDLAKVEQRAGLEKIDRDISDKAALK